MDAEIPRSPEDFHDAQRRQGFPTRLRRVLIGLGVIGLSLACAAAFASGTDEDASLIPASIRSNAPDRLYTRTSIGDDRYRITTRFDSFDGEPLTVGFELSRDASRASVHEFGIGDAELDALLAACRRRVCEQADFDRRTSQYYRAHGLRLREDAQQRTHLFVDVAQAVERNRERVRPVAQALEALARARGEDRAWTIDAAVALVQSGLLYRQPAAAEDGRRILGFYPPPRALERGYGDCDTKAALLAAILQNLTDAPIIGVHVPHHYLLGIAGKPGAGQAALRYEGRSYVLVEAAGPGRRRPGSIAQPTALALAQPQGVRIDPMF
ncbi:hypothetical protein [Solimonas marina]|uniref:Transglutaminase domain-containing protein n=1 Tax=Solimonas marina TaxID=2714601 RepID=A0A970B838_9GAMM|nr:hypothetical protein [Solimonas marina]NKF21021.1 hypothetical protein [Solimonas marina]